MFAFQHSAHAQYCASTASNTADEWISNVTFAGINNNSGSNTYTDYTAISASVQPGQSYPISVTITNGTTVQFTETVRVWVDWNQDFTFSTDEQYDVGSMPVPGSSSLVFNTSIPVPAGATAGATRMRVTLRFSTYAGPCDSFTWGEVEDYTVTVSGGDPDPDPDPDPEAPENDLCSTAIAVTCGSTITGTTAGASAQEVPSCNLVFPGQGVWYSLVGNGGTITLSTCSSNTNFDTQIGVFSGSCTSLSCVAGNNNDTGCANSRQSTVSFPSTAGTTYYIYVTGVLGANGNFSLSIACTPPPIVNDNCSGALPIACGQTVSGSTTGAGVENVSFCGTSLSTAPGVWYTITGTGGLITLTTCNAGTNYDTKLGVFSGTCGGLVCVAGNDDATCALGAGRSTVTFASTAGTTYYILVTGFLTNNGNFGLSATCLPIPPNNACAGAVPVSCGQTVSGTTIGATINPPVTSCGTTIGTAGGVWYSVAGTGFDITVTTCNPGTNYDTKLAVFSGSCGSLTCVGGNDDGSPGGGPDPACFTVPGVNVNRASTFTFASTAGVTYYVYVTGFGTNTGNHQLSVICEEPPPVSPNCENATPVFCGDFIQASTSGGQINNFGSSCGTSQSANISTAPGVWYQFTATNNFLVTLNTCFPATDFDSKLAVFSGSCGDLTCVAVNDNAGGNCSVLFGRPAAVTFEALAGNTYYIYVTGHQGANGNFAMSVSCSILNDLCANALPIECGEAVNGSTTGATADNVPDCGTSLNTAPGVWYTFLGNGLELTLETCAPTGFDTKLGVFEGTCGALQCVAGNDDDCGLRSRVTFDSEDGVTYYVLVTGFGSANGAFTLTFVGDCGAPPPPPPGNNDFCDGATLVSCGSVVTGTTTDATAEAVPTCGTALNTAPGRWYRFVGTGEQVVATTCNPGTNFDTKLGVFTGACGGLVCVAGNDDGSPGGGQDPACFSVPGLNINRASTVSFLSAPGVDYYIYVTGFLTATGNYELSFTCTPGPT
jgi:hypothetical protein